MQRDALSVGSRGISITTPTLMPPRSRPVKAAKIACRVLGKAFMGEPPVLCGRQMVRPSSPPDAVVQSKD